MAPVEFEKNLKERLCDQEIQPSEDAWKRLSGQLDAASPQKSRSHPGISGRYWRFTVAATLVLAFGIWMFRQPDIPGSGGPAEVALPGNGSMEPEPGSSPDMPDVQPAMPVRPESGNLPAEALAERPVQVVPDHTVRRPGSRAGNADPVVSGNSLLVADNPPVTDPPLTDLARQASDTTGLADQITQQLLAVQTEVAAREARDGPVSEATIDSLLEMAQHRIAAERTAVKDTVDALALLSEVELELDRTFREELFDKLKTGFNRVRTAVADRNN